MKIRRLIPQALAAVLLAASVVLAGFAVAQTKTRINPPVPIIVKNDPPGPTLLASRATDPLTWNLVEEEGMLGFKRGSSQLTNILVQAYFATVEVDANNNLFLSNATASPATNYFASGSGYFNGNQTVPFGVNSNYSDWAYADFHLDNSQFITNNRGHSLLLFLGKAGDQEAAYVYSAVSPVNSTNYHSSAISTKKHDFVGTNGIYGFDIHAPSGVSTNMNLRAYLATVQTNGSGDLFLTNVAGAPNCIDTNNYLVGATNLFDGVTAVKINPGTSSKVEFALNGETFEVDGQGPCYLVFLGSSTNGGARFEVSYIYLVRP